MFSPKGAKFNEICKILDNGGAERDLALIKGND